MIPDDVRGIIMECLLTAKSEWLIEGEIEEAKDCEKAIDWVLSQPVAPEPDWSQAPEWAQWWALNALQTAFWFEEEPVQFNEWWGATSIQVEKIGQVELPLGIDWRQTLRKRPEAE